MSGPTTWQAQPRRPAWGVRTPRRKSLATQMPILAAPPPARVTIPLGNSAQTSTQPGASPLVVCGQVVRCGEPLAAPGSPGHPAIHASIAGRIAAIGTYPVAGSAQPLPCIVIERARSESCESEPWWDGYPPRPDAETLPAAELRRQIASAGIVGLGGALFPTALKLAAAGEQPRLLLNGAECEAYISCDDMLLRERAGRVVAGARILCKALGAELAVIAIKTDMPEARAALLAALDQAGDPRLAISTVTAKYPAGGERQLIELVFGREVPAGGLPADIGVICHNVATAAAVADFFLEGRPLVSRIITISGGGIAQPRNIEARIGTPISELVALAGGYTGNPQRLIMGGPMMGIALPDDALPVSAATNCVIAATAAELGDTAPEQPCIRCGLCVEACPAGLMPQDLLAAVRMASSDRLAALGVSECIECGACDYSCPSHIHLATRFQAGKQMASRARLARERASIARERFEARTQRLARNSAEQQDTPVGPSALDALLARSRQRGKAPDNDKAE
ncbi:MAG: electron transport complex subunit RsxC [Gammaproteobacteria bacterium]|jgi:electron transport complex protein RnfC|nr:electron transport complex subunit RsxC [Gammaproteobacteria bacterium]